MSDTMPTLEIYMYYYSVPNTTTTLKSYICIVTLI